MKTDCELLDALKKHYDLKLDSGLCSWLGMSPTQISQVRSKTSPRALTTKQRVIAYDHLGYAWAREAMLDLFPEHISQKLREMDNSKTKKYAAKSKEKDEPLQGLQAKAAESSLN